MRVRISGRIMNDDYARLYRSFGYQNVCSPRDIRMALEQPEDEEGLIFEVNSGGGSVYDGYEMYTVLKNSARKTTVEIQSIAASAASVLAMGADRVLISPVASLMIHRASTAAEGNEEDLSRKAQMLRTVDQGILNAYEAKCQGKTSREALEEMMGNETFMTASEALERGFADGILWESEDPDAKLTSSAVAMAGGIQAVMEPLPPIEEIRNRAEAQKKREGKPTDKPKEEANMPMTMDELERENAELIAQIRADAAKKERERLNGIDNMAMPGFEDLIDAAKLDPAATAESVAAQIVARQKQQGADFLKNRKKDIQDSGIPKVKEDKPEGKADDEAELNAVLDTIFPQAQ